MSELYDFKELVKRSGLPERTVRYYLANVVNAPGGTRGRKTFYSQETLDQLMLAKKVMMREYDHKRGEVKPSLVDFKDWMQNLNASEIHQIVNSPGQIKIKTIYPVYNRPSSQIQEASAIEFESPTRVAASRASSKEEKEDINDSAAQYLNRVMGSTPEPKPVTRKEWQSFRFGNDLVIKTRERLTPEQKDQLELAGKLLQSVLKERK